MIGNARRAFAESGAAMPFAITTPSVKKVAQKRLQAFLSHFFHRRGRNGKRHCSAAFCESAARIPNHFRCSSMVWMRVLAR